MVFESQAVYLIGKTSFYHVDKERPIENLI